MFRFPLSLIALTLTFACGSGPKGSPDPSSLTGTTPTGTPTTTTDPSTTTTPGVDETAPTVLSTTPVDSTFGHRAETTVIIRFSEPMDTASVEDALETSSLGEVSILWNAANDEVEIVPTQDLAYAETALTYSLSLADGPMDKAGNLLENGVDIDFQTLRSLTVFLPYEPALTQTITPSTVERVGFELLELGDTANNLALRATFSFELADIPVAAVEVHSAILHAAQLPASFTGNPYGNLGAHTILDHVSFDSLDAEADVNAAFNSSDAAWASHSNFSSNGQFFIDFDVTADVEDDRANRQSRNDRSQYLVSFEDFTNLDGYRDTAVLFLGVVELEVSYLVP